MNNRQCETAKKNLRDNKVPGLMLSVGKQSKNFYLYRRVEGKPRRIMLGHFPGMTVEQARRKALSILEGIENCTFGKPATLGKLWGVCCDVKRTKKSLDQDVDHYDRHLAAWSGLKLDTITLADVQRLHNRTLLELVARQRKNDDFVAYSGQNLEDEGRRMSADRTNFPRRRGLR